MTAIQINGFSKGIRVLLCEIPQPNISDAEVLIQVKAAAANLAFYAPGQRGGAHQFYAEYAFPIEYTSLRNVI